MKLGDTFEKYVGQPIAKTIDSVAGTDIQNCVKCGERKQSLNRFGDFVAGWFTNNKTGEQMTIKGYSIQVKTVDNGYVIQADQPNVSGTRKQLIATSDDDLKTKMKDLVDHMFDEPEKKPVEEGGVKPGPRIIKPGGSSQVMTGGPNG